MSNVNKAGSIVNINRLKWINSRHIRSLFDEKQDAQHHEKQEIVSSILPYISPALHLKQEQLLNEFGIDYIWKAFDLMKVFCSFSICGDDACLMIRYRNGFMYYQISWSCVVRSTSLRISSRKQLRK